MLLIVEPNLLINTSLFMSIYVHLTHLPSLVQCVSSYTLSSPVFKGVTRGMNFKHTSPVPVIPGFQA